MTHLNGSIYVAGKSGIILQMVASDLSQEYSEKGVAAWPHGSA